MKELNDKQVNKMVNDYINQKTSKDGDWKEFDVVCPFCKASNLCYLYIDNKQVYCCGCDKEFDSVILMDTPGTDRELLEIETEVDDGTRYLSQEYAEVSKAAKEIIDSSVSGQKVQDLKLPGTPGYTQPTVPQSMTAGYGQGNWTGCTHIPTHVISGRGFGVWAGKRQDVLWDVDEFDVVLNLAYGSVAQTHNIPIPELQKYEAYGSKFKEINLDWPDFGIVHLPRKFWEDLMEYLIDNKYKMIVFCQGGHGRTGTALACLMIVCFNWSGQKAIDWVRSNYCNAAIESWEQEQYIKRIARQKKRTDKIETENITPEKKKTKEQSKESDMEEFDIVLDDGSRVGRGEEELYCRGCQKLMPFEHIHVYGQPLGPKQQESLKKIQI